MEDGGQGTRVRVKTQAEAIRRISYECNGSKNGKRYMLCYGYIRACMYMYMRVDIQIDNLIRIRAYIVRTTP